MYYKGNCPTRHPNNADNKLDCSGLMHIIINSHLSKLDFTCFFITILPRTLPQTIAKILLKASQEWSYYLQTEDELRQRKYAYLQGIGILMLPFSLRMRWKFSLSVTFPFRNCTLLSSNKLDKLGHLSWLWNSSSEWLCYSSGCGLSKLALDVVLR